MASGTSYPPLSIEAEHAFVWVVCAVTLLGPDQEGAKRQPRHEPSDMSPPCDASAGGRQQELQRSLENLNQEPETDEEERPHHDDPRQGEEAHEASQHSRDCTGGAQRRHDRCWIKKDMRNRGSKAASEIKGEIASVTQPILHRGSEQPER